MSIQDPTVLPLAPNWAKYVVETLEYRTDVFTTSDGREQRRGVRVVPRRTFEYLALCHGSAMRQWSALDGSRHPFPWVVPEWPYATHLTAPVGPLDDVLTLDELPRGLAPGDYVVVRTTQGLVSAQVLALDPGMNTVQVVSPLGVSVAAGFRAYRGSIGHLGASTAHVVHTDIVQEPTIRLDLLPESRLPPLGVAGQTFDGREIWLATHNWGEQLARNSEYDDRVVDFGRGAVSRAYLADFSRQVTTWKVLGRKPDILSCIEFFCRARGRLRAFYRPSMTNDLLFRGMTSSTLTVANDNITLAEGNPVFGTLALRMRDGSVWPNQIVSMAPVADDVVITVRDPWPAVVQATEVKMVCWMPLSRFETDMVTVSWVTDQVGYLDLITRTLPVG